MILINGQFPGPLIEANSGDIIRVNVNNLMSNWSIAMHWHGLDQKNSVQMDGVAGITQCGILQYRRPRNSFRNSRQKSSVDRSGIIFTCRPSILMVCWALWWVPYFLIGIALLLRPHD